MFYYNAKSILRLVACTKCIKMMMMILLIHLRFSKYDRTILYRVYSGPAYIGNCVTEFDLVQIVKRSKPSRL
jgi:hypothetical protein